MKNSTDQINSCKVHLVFREQANFNELTSTFDSVKKNNDVVSERKLLLSTCAGEVNAGLKLKIPFLYNKKVLDAQANDRIINCAKLNETTNRWYTTEAAREIDGSYLCEVSSLSYFSVIFTHKDLLQDVNSLSGAGFDMGKFIIMMIIDFFLF